MKIIIFLFLFSFSSCREKEYKDPTANPLYAYWVIAGCGETNYCDDNSWTQGRYAGAIQLQKEGQSKCGGLYTFAKTRIYDENSTLITNNSISSVIPLRCMSIENNKIREGIYSWYLKDAEIPKRYNFLFQHSLTRDSSGQILSTDTFSAYKSGDTILCCSEIDVTYGICTYPRKIVIHCEELIIN